VVDQQMARNEGVEQPGRAERLPVGGSRLLDLPMEDAVATEDEAGGVSE